MQIDAWQRNYDTTAMMEQSDPVPVRPQYLTSIAFVFKQYFLATSSLDRFFISQASALTPEGHATNQALLKDIFCQRMNLATFPGAVPASEWNDVMNNPTLTYRFMRSYTFYISYSQAYVRARHYHQSAA